MKTTITSTVITIFILINSLQSICQTPNWLWAKGGNGYFSVGQTLDTDSSKNIYNAGGFLQTQVIGNDTLTAWSGMDCYISKLDSNGNYIWTTSISGNQAEMIYDITIDEPHSAIYI